MCGVHMYVTVLCLKAILILSASFLCQPYIPLSNEFFIYLYNSAVRYSCDKPKSVRVFVRLSMGDF